MMEMSSSELSKKDDKDLYCIVVAGGTISSHKGCNIPSAPIDVDVLTEKDKKDLAFIAKLDPEYVAASFIGSGRDVEDVRSYLSQCGNNKIKIISKIERQLALNNLDDIIAASDAIMVARGDLGVEVEPYLVPPAQKDMIKRCNKEGKPVIVATQMLESMIQNARPTRAEASDVFNAVTDGADAVMLSAESSVGKYPVIAVKCMDDIVGIAENYIADRDPKDYDSKHMDVSETIGHAAYLLANEFSQLNSMKGKIIVLTESGYAAKLVSKYRPPLPIIAFTPHLRVARELNLVWGVRAVYDPNCGESKPIEERAVEAVKLSINKGLLTLGSDVNVLIVSASSYSQAGVLTGLYDVNKLIECTTTATKS